MPLRPAPDCRPGSEERPLSARLDEAKRRLRFLIDRGELAAAATEILVALDSLDAALNETARLQEELTSLQGAFDLQQGIIADQNTRIEILEKAISEFLDPEQSRDGLFNLMAAMRQGELDDL